MWNIPEQQVVDWADVHEMVTAVNFAPDGAKAIVGTMKGKCRFYRCSNFHLEYEAQIGIGSGIGQAQSADPVLLLLVHACKLLHVACEVRHYL